MAHKGYTLNYFIDFFSSIPAHRWTEGTLQNGETVQKCALGHSLSDQRATPNSRVSMRKHNERTKALQSFLNRKTVDINDGNSPFEELGSTPRGRILRALRNRKRNGTVL